jgi:hypothetical protein
MEVWALGEVGGLAGQGVLDQLLGLLGLTDLLVQSGVLLSQNSLPFWTARSVEHPADLLEAEAGRLGPLDHHHPGHVRFVVLASSADAAGRGEQPLVLPVSEDVGREPEPGRQLADAEPQIADVTPPSMVMMAPVT